jgi:predicted RNase H-like nuclease (RuvC/YqgF family)
MASWHDDFKNDPSGRAAEELFSQFFQRVDLLYSFLWYSQFLKDDSKNALMTCITGKGPDGKRAGKDQMASSGCRNVDSKNPLYIRALGDFKSLTKDVNTLKNGMNNDSDTAVTDVIDDIKSYWKTVTDNISAKNLDINDLKASADSLKGSLSQYLWSLTGIRNATEAWEHLKNQFYRTYKFSGVAGFDDIKNTNYANLGDRTIELNGGPEPAPIQPAPGAGMYPKQAEEAPFVVLPSAPPAPEPSAPPVPEPAGPPPAFAPGSTENAIMAAAAQQGDVANALKEQQLQANAQTMMEQEATLAQQKEHINVIESQLSQLQTMLRNMPSNVQEKRVLDDKILELEDQIKGLNANIAAYESQIAAANGLRDTQSKKIKEYELHLSAIGKALDQVQEERNRLTYANQAAESELADVKQKLEQCQADIASHQGKKITFNNQEFNNCDDALKEAARLLEDKGRQANETPENTALLAEIGVLKGEIASLEKQKKDSTEAIDKLMKQNEVLATLKDQCASRVQAAIDQAVNINAKFSKLQSERDTATRKLTEQQTELEELRRSKAQQKQQLKEARAALGKTSTEAIEAQRVFFQERETARDAQIDQLRKSLETCSSPIKDLKNSLEECEKARGVLQTGNSQLIVQIAELRKKLADEKGVGLVQQTINEWKAKFDATNDELERSKKQILETKVEEEGKRNYMEAVLTERTKQVEILTEQLRLAKEAIKGTDTDLQARLRSVQEQLVTSQKDLEEMSKLKGENDALRQQLAACNATTGPVIVAPVPTRPTPSESPIPPVPEAFTPPAPPMVMASGTKGATHDPRYDRETKVVESSGTIAPGSLKSEMLGTACALASPKTPQMEGCFATPDNNAPCENVRDAVRGQCGLHRVAVPPDSPLGGTAAEFKVFRALDPGTQIKLHLHKARSYWSQGVTMMIYSSRYALNRWMVPLVGNKEDTKLSRNDIASIILNFPGDYNNLLSAIKNHTTTENKTFIAPEYNAILPQGADYRSYKNEMTPNSSMQYEAFPLWYNGNSNAALVAQRYADRPGKTLATGKNAIDAAARHLVYALAILMFYTPVDQKALVGDGDVPYGSMIFLTEVERNTFTALARFIHDMNTGIPNHAVFDSDIDTRKIYTEILRYLVYGTNEGNTREQYKYVLSHMDEQRDVISKFLTEIKTFGSVWSNTSMAEEVRKEGGKAHLNAF